LHYSLGVGLHEQGSFAASLASLRQAQKLGSQNPKLPLLIQHVEQYVVLDAKLPKIMNGETLPGSPAERIFLAKMCQLTSRQLHATAARFYSEAFALEPKLAEPKVGTDLVTQSRYCAACAAALAGWGQGKNAANLEPAEYIRLRAQALAWLRADLSVWCSLLDKEPESARSQVLQYMVHWQHDSDFNGVRSGAALAKLPEAEQRDWRKLWQEVEELRKRAAESERTPAGSSGLPGRSL
jgi:hypothetical protein